MERCRFSGMKIVYGLARLCWISCWRKSNTCQNNLNTLPQLSKWNSQFFISNVFLAENSVCSKKITVKIEIMCATVRGFSVQWQLLFLSSFPSPPTVDLPSTKNIHHICRSVSDYSISQLFPFALCHFYSYPTLLKHWFSKFSWFLVVCLTSITLRYLYAYSISSDRVGESCGNNSFSSV